MSLKSVFFGLAVLLSASSVSVAQSLPNYGPNPPRNTDSFGQPPSGGQTARRVALRAPGLRVCPEPASSSLPVLASPSLALVKAIRLRSSGGQWPEPSLARASQPVQ